MENIYLSPFHHISLTCYTIWLVHICTWGHHTNGIIRSLQYDAVGAFWDCSKVSDINMIEFWTMGEIRLFGHIIYKHFGITIYMYKHIILHVTMWNIIHNLVKTVCEYINQILFSHFCMLSIRVLCWHCNVWWLLL